MTLFHLREFWSTNLGDDEEFDKLSICVANIDNEPDGFDKIIVGSFNGIVRIFKIILNNNNNDQIKTNEQNLFQISDQLLEVDFKNPILQIASGYLLNSANVQLAILHPNKLCVYSISSTSGVTDHGTSYNILLIYELEFSHKAVNMLIGPLGQTTKGKDIICIQNIESTFEFYENETFSFGYNWNHRQTNNNNGLLKKFPIDFTYIPNRDFIIIVDDLYTIQCYQYRELAMNSTTANNSFNNNNDGQGKISVPEWSYEFGEPIIDLQTVQLDRWYIGILGEKNLCVLRDNGTLFFVKKFDSNPSCFCIFGNDKKDSIIILIGTHMNNMLLYQNDILRWATKIPFIPIAIRRANLNDITGSIVLLSDQGQLTVGYLGTNPSLRIIALPLLQTNTGNNEKIEEELMELKKMINFEHMNSNQNQNQIENERENRLTDGPIDINLIECQKNQQSERLMIMIIELIPSKTIHNIKLLLHQNDFYIIEPEEILIDKLDQRQQFQLRIQFKHENLLSLSTKIKYSIMYTMDNVSRIITKNLFIPFECLVKLISSSSTSTTTTMNGGQKYSIKILFTKSSSSTTDSKSTQLLSNLFGDLFQTNHSNNFSFCFENYEQIHSTIKIQWSESNVTIIVESNDLGGLYITLQQLFWRILTNKSPETKKIESIQMNFNLIDQLQLAISNRINRKNQMKKIKDEISKFSQHYRVLQKRILVKSKDKTPASLDNFSKLLTLIQKKITKNIDNIIHLEKLINICNYHVWTILNIWRLILEQGRKSNSTDSLEKFSKLIQIYQLSNFNNDWEELFLQSILEIFQMNKDLVKMIQMIEPKQQQQQQQKQKQQQNEQKILLNIFNQIQEKLSIDLISIEFSN
ncbi:Protein PTHB1 [Dermatophagoides pteronyssinus]|uniref:Protein PTHB1 n=1 Tax=Dermatophagoides pteronyssinus TaxID=6956 RepID=A0ABQ8J259_DERPT|nr:Protein PTHB1 [Dermatophagoides pteronyssinus]